MRKSLFYVLVAIIFILGAFSPAISSAQAQTPPPPREPERQQPCLPGQPCEDENGDRFIIPTEETLAAPTAIGDSDDYGYTLSSATYSWISAADGINTGIDETRDITAAISLPFAFPFYENSYTQLYITGAGYLTFDDYDWVNWGYFLPDENEPNNFISVLSKYQYYSGSAVYYKNFGTHFVIQWNHLLDYEGGVYTFEVVLYPTGNIKFQYKTMPDPSNGWWCSASGIENATGLDGLTFWDQCQRPTSANTAVLFTKPGPSARVGASPLYLGEFAYSLDVDEFSFGITNSGDLGADTYDMVVTTAPLGGFSVELFDTGGVPLTDTDADGMVDSGSLAQGASKEIIARVSAPDGLSLGAAVKTYIDISSSLNPAKTKMVTIDSTVPAAFAQTYKDEESHTLWTDLNWPVKQVEAEVSSDAWMNNNDPAIIETADHNFVHVWMDYYWGQNANGLEVRYAVVDRFGQVIKAPATLSSIYDGADYYTSQRESALALAPDGKIGLVWTRYMYHYPDDYSNYNIFFAVLNPSGTIAYGPVNLTNNEAWGSGQAGNMVQLFSPDISASEDNRFFITWRKSDQSVSTQDVHYSICQSSGAMVVQPTAMTTSDWTQMYYPGAQIALSGNRFFVTYEYIYISGQYYYQDFLYRVFDSSGGTLTPPSDLHFYADSAIQLSGGNILLASSAYGDVIYYQIRNGTTYAFISESTLSHPSTSEVGYGTLGVTKDALNRGILTWSDENNRYLYYAYVQGSNGAPLSGPVIFHRSDWLGLSYTGSSITTNSWSPAVGIDLIGEFSSNMFGAAPGGTAMLQLWNSNVGTDTAEFPELTLTLPAGLTYVGDTSGVTPDLVGSTVVWQLPELAYGSSEDFVVYLAVDGATPVPSFFDVSLELTSEGADVNPANNTDTTQVLVGLQSFLPLMLR